MTNDRIALVTGANKGIGREIARRLAELRYIVWLGCRDAGRGEAAAAALREAGGDVRFLPLDVADDKSVTHAARRARASDGAARRSRQQCRDRRGGRRAERRVGRGDEGDL